jgi:hypothetical protein
MGKVGLGLGYRLPRTQVSVRTTHRNTVVSGDNGSVVAQVVDVELQPSAVEDASQRMILFVDQGLLEKISLKVELDDRGFIQSLNGTAGRDVSPVISLLGKAIGLAATIAILGLVDVPAQTTPGNTLDEKWRAKFPDLEVRRAELEAQAKRLLAQVADATTQTPDITAAGRALDVVQGQLSLISQARRAWIAGHAAVVGSKAWKFTTSELCKVDGSEFPDELTNPRISTALRPMTTEFETLVAIIDDERPPPVRRKTEETLIDQVALRRSRPAQLAIYRLSRGSWLLDPTSVRSLDIVDSFSTLDYMSLEGTFLRERSFELTYHPDMSLKTFGLTTTSNVAAIATSTGEVMDAIGAARKALSEKPSEDEVELEKAKTQLDLLKTASEYEVLSATRERAGEAAVLEQEKKIRDARA